MRTCVRSLTTRIEHGPGIVEGVTGPGAQRREDRETVRQGPVDDLLLDRQHGLEAVNRAKHAARGGIEQERLARMVEQGMTIAQMAAAIRVSKTTVRYWL